MIQNIDYKIREAQQKDYETLCDLRLQMQKHMEKSNPLIWSYSEEGKRRIKDHVDEMLSGDGKLLVAEHENNVIGYIYGFVRHRDTLLPASIGFLGIIFIKEAYRRRGIGTNMVKELCKYFQMQGVEQVNLRYVIGNKEAETFWRTLGLVPVIKTALVDFHTFRENLGN